MRIRVISTYRGKNNILRQRKHHRINVLWPRPSEENRSAHITLHSPSVPAESSQIGLDVQQRNDPPRTKLVQPTNQPSLFAQPRWASKNSESTPLRGDHPNDAASHAGTVLRLLLTKKFFVLAKFSSAPSSPHKRVPVARDETGRPTGSCSLQPTNRATLSGSARQHRLFITRVLSALGFQLTGALLGAPEPSISKVRWVQRERHQQETKESRPYYENHRGNSAAELTTHSFTSIGVPK